VNKLRTIRKLRYFLVPNPIRLFHRLRVDGGDESATHNEDALVP